MPFTHKSPHQKKRGQAIIIVVMICLILGIFAGGVFNFQRGQIHLLSKSAGDYLALSVAEAGLHSVLAEMRADYQFTTHGSPYIPIKDEAGGKTLWQQPAAHKYLHLQSSSLIKFDKNEKGTYTGSIMFKKSGRKGFFKVRMKLIGSKNSTATKTVDEAHKYFLLEALGNVETSCRKVTAVVEKVTPGSFLFYDGQILDMGGQGPQRVTPGIIRNGRLYGHQMLLFSRRGSTDRGLEYLDTEKISSPGVIKAKGAAPITFINGKRGTIKASNDSENPKTFNTFAESITKDKFNHLFVLDGFHGAKSQKLPPLNPLYYKNAKKPSPVLLRQGSSFKGFSESKWRNPGRPLETVYDLFFGWKYEKKDSKMLIYSEVPLRIWGCPEWKALTIFCEKDIYIAGDFNANPDNPQSYTAGYKEYKKAPRNGTDKNGAMIMSMGRIWYDYSNPMHFLRNEMKTVIDYDIAIALSTDNLSDVVIKSVVAPPRVSTTSGGSRMPMTALNFKAINILFSLPKSPPEAAAAIAASIGMQPALKRLRNYLCPDGETDEQTGTTRQSASDSGSNDDSIGYTFGIKNAFKRALIYEEIGNLAYTTGTILPQSRDRIIEKILNQAEKDIESGEEPDAKLGAWHIADRMCKLALKYPNSSFRMPEMTVNALCIDSAELNARWVMGNSTNKAQNELGNVKNNYMKSLPFIGPNGRFILRHMGGCVHLRTTQSKQFVDGSFRNDQSVMRKDVFDSTYSSGGGDYFPPYPMAGFVLINWKDEAITKKEFDEAK